MIEAYHVSKKYARGVYALRDSRFASKKATSSSSPARAAPESPRCFVCCCARTSRPKGNSWSAAAISSTLTRAPGPELPPLAWLRVPGFQAAASEDGARERLVRAARARHGAVAAAAPHVSGAQVGGTAAPDECLSARAVGRRAAAHRDRARAGQRSRRSSWPTSRPATSIRTCRSRS